MRRHCDACGKPYEAKRERSRFCGDTCQKRSRRARGPVAEAEEPQPRVRPLPVPSADTGLAAATERTLREAGRLDTYLGQSAVALAERIEARSSADTGSAYAALHRELRAVMAEALRGASVAADPIDELRARRDRKLGAR